MVYGTGSAIGHLKKKHGVTEEGTAATTTGGNQDIQAMILKQAGLTGEARNFDPKVYSSLLVQFFIASRLPFEIIAHPDFRALETYSMTCNAASMKTDQKALPKSPKTIAAWIEKYYVKAKLKLKEMMSKAESKIVLVFDVWTAGNAVPIFAVNGSFIEAGTKNV